jgi:hypothetical protein
MAAAADALRHSQGLQARDTELEAVAGLLINVINAAERNHRVDAAVVVDPPAAGLQPRRGLAGLVPVRGPDRGTSPTSSPLALAITSSRSV